MNLVINEALKAYIDPLTRDEYEALERSILREGCRDALVVWGDMLVDGHNRYGICQKHGVPFQTVQSTLFKSIDDVHLWMIDQHLGRRSVSDFQRGVLALRKREILSTRHALAPLQTVGGGIASDLVREQSSTPVDGEQFKSRDALAKAARLTNNQVVLIEKIHKQAVPELVAAVKAGAISMNAAAAVATLPADQQLAAAVAGAEELKQAAKRVRERKRSATNDAPSAAANAHDGQPPEDALQRLQRRVAELESENAALRKQVAELVGT